MARVYVGHVYRASTQDETHVYGDQAKVVALLRTLAVGDSLTVEAEEA